MVTVQREDVLSGFWQMLAYTQLIAKGLASSFERRVAKGESPEAILEELLESLTQADERSESGNTAPLIAALLFVVRGDYEKALGEISKADKELTSIDWTIGFMRGNILFLMDKYDEAALAFSGSADSLDKLLRISEGPSLVASGIRDIGRDYYVRWSAIIIVQALQAIAQSDQARFEESIKEMATLLSRCHSLSLEHVVWDTFALFEKKLPDEISYALQDFRAAVKFTDAMQKFREEEDFLATAARIFLIPITRVKGITAKELVERVGNLAIPEGFGEDLAAIKASQPVMEPSAWDS